MNRPTELLYVNRDDWAAAYDGPEGLSDRLTKKFGKDRSGDIREEHVRTPYPPLFLLVPLPHILMWTGFMSSQHKPSNSSPSSPPSASFSPSYLTLSLHPVILLSSSNLSPHLTQANDLSSGRCFLVDPRKLSHFWRVLNRSTPPPSGVQTLVVKGTPVGLHMSDDVRLLLII